MRVACGFSNDRRTFFHLAIWIFTFTFIWSQRFVCSQLNPQRSQCCTVLCVYTKIWRTIIKSDVFCFVVFISTVHARVCSMDFLLSRVERGNDNVVVCLLFRFGLCSQHKRSLHYFVLSISRTDLKQIVLPLCFGSNIWLSQAFRMTFISNLWQDKIGEWSLSQNGIQNNRVVEVDCAVKVKWIYFSYVDGLNAAYSGWAGHWEWSFDREVQCQLY